MKEIKVEIVHEVDGVIVVESVDDVIERETK